MRTQSNIRFMRPEEQKDLPESHKRHPLTKGFIGVWTRFTNWDNNPPIIALDERDRILGFHAATFNKKIYVNSYYLYIVDGYRGDGLGGDLFEYAIKEALSRKLTRYKMACKINGDGDIFYRGFGLKPVARNAHHHFYDFSIEGFKSLDKLPKNKNIPFKALEFHRKKGREILLPSLFEDEA